MIYNCRESIFKFREIRSQKSILGVFKFILDVKRSLQSFLQIGHPICNELFNLQIVRPMYKSDECALRMQHTCYF